MENHWPAFTHLRHLGNGNVATWRRVGHGIGGSVPVVLRPLARNGVTFLGRGRILRTLHHLDRGKGGERWIVTGTVVKEWRVNSRKEKSKSLAWPDCFRFSLTWAILGTGISPPGAGSATAFAAAFQLYCARWGAMLSRFGAFCASSTTLMAKGMKGKLGKEVTKGNGRVRAQRDGVWWAVLCVFCTHRRHLGHGHIASRCGVSHSVGGGVPIVLRSFIRNIVALLRWWRILCVFHHLRWGEEVCSRACWAPATCAFRPDP